MSKQTKTALKGVETDLIKTHQAEFAGKAFTGIDLANEAGKLQTKADNLSDSQDVFGQKFILFARTCASWEEFLSLSGSVEARKSWKSKQNPEGSKTAPTVWKQYKSNIKVAWSDFGISPQDVKTVHELNKALQEARKAKTEADSTTSGEATTDALAKAINVDSRLASVIGAITQCFDALEQEDQGDMLEALEAVYYQFEAGNEESDLEDETALLASHLEDQQAAVQQVQGH